MCEEEGKCREWIRGHSFWTLPLQINLCHRYFQTTAVLLHAATRRCTRTVLTQMSSTVLWASLWGGDTSTVSPGDQCTCQSPAEHPECSPHVFPGQLTAASPPPLTTHFHWYIFRSSLLQQSANFRYVPRKHSHKFVFSVLLGKRS